MANLILAHAVKNAQVQSNSFTFGFIERPDGNKMRGRASCSKLDPRFIYCPERKQHAGLGQITLISLHKPPLIVIE